MAVGGLETILKQINSESNEVIEKIIAKANLEAKKIIADAEVKSENMMKNANTKAEVVYANISEREKTSAEHERKQKILEEKQNILNSVISNSVEEIKKLDKDKYFDVLTSLLKKYVSNSSENAELMLNKKDISGMTDNFKKLLEKNYPNLRVTENNSINLGFIIKKGDIEDNCTIDALIEDKSDVIKEKVYKKLFG